jgi:protein-arginine kinase activator protein McsA
MSIDEQETIKKKYYSEAIRYMDNAKETLGKAGKEDKYYNDKKYVRTACGTAYNGVLIALDTYLLLKGIKKTRGRKSIEYYQEHISKVDKKLLKHINCAYEILHLSGYYDGILSATVIKEGFNEAYEIIDQIKPD